MNGTRRNGAGSNDAGRNATRRNGEGQRDKTGNGGALQTPAKHRNTRRNRSVEALLDHAEAAYRCAATRTPAEAVALRRRVRSGYLVQPYPRVFARTALWNGLRPNAQALYLMRALSQLHPAWVFCSLSAAVAYGLSCSYALLGRIHICGGQRSHVRETQHVVRYGLENVDPATVEGLRVTPLLQTLMEALLRVPFPEGLALADSALRCYRLSRETLTRHLCNHGKRRHGVETALRVAELADGRAENGGESALRGIIIQEGFLPPAMLQAEFADPLEPRRSVRVDLLWELPDGRNVVGELDGMGKYTDVGMLMGRSTAEALVSERQRESHLTALGMPVARFLSRRLYEPGYVAGVLNAYSIPRVGPPWEELRAPSLENGG